MKKPIVLGALMIGGAMIFCPIKAYATPTAGAVKALADAQNEARLKPPIAAWQQAILDKATDPNEIKDEPKKRKVKQKKRKVKTNNYIYESSRTLNRNDGIFYGPSGRESYYNLDMSWIVGRMHRLGYSYEYWVRKDGVKMFGPYVMVAAKLDIRPLGTILKMSLGDAIVVDTGGFTKKYPTGLDVAVAW